MLGVLKEDFTIANNAYYNYICGYGEGIIKVARKPWPSLYLNVVSSKINGKVSVLLDFF